MNETSPIRPSANDDTPPAAAAILDHFELVERLKLGFAGQATMLKEHADEIDQLKRDAACPHDRLEAIEKGLAELTNIVFGRGI